MKRKQLPHLFFLAILVFFSSCKKDETDVVTPNNTPEYQKAIDDKYQALGWNTDGHVVVSGTTPVSTQGNKGYVQYYTYQNTKTAIYYFQGRGAFAMNAAEAETYDAVGQDKFAIITSDPKSCGTGCGYNDMITVSDNAEGIILWEFIVSGDFYKKYKAMNRWDGVLGTPAGNTYKWTTKEFVQTYASQKFLKGTITIGITYPTGLGAVAIDEQFYTIWEDKMKTGSPQFFADWPLADSEVSSTGRRFQRFRWFTMYQAQNIANTAVMRNAVFDNYFKNIGYEKSVFGNPVAGWPVWDESGKYYLHNFENGKWIKWYLDTIKYDFGG